MPQWLPMVEYFTFQNSVISNIPYKSSLNLLTETACILLYNGSLEWVMCLNRSYNEF